MRKKSQQRRKIKRQKDKTLVSNYNTYDRGWIDELEAEFTKTRHPWSYVSWLNPDFQLNFIWNQLKCKQLDTTLMDSLDEVIRNRKILTWDVVSQISSEEVCLLVCFFLSSWQIHLSHCYCLPSFILEQTLSDFQCGLNEKLLTRST